LLRRALILLMMLLLPLQTMAGSFAPLCRHTAGEQAAALQMAMQPMDGDEHAHCHEAMAAAATPDPDTPAAGDAGCDDCTVCHHVAFSLFSLPVVPGAVAFNPVRVARDLPPSATRVPPQPDRPPRAAAA